MKKIIICCIFLFPVVAFSAPDISDCEIIGHERGTLTVENACLTAADCELDKEDADAYALCIKNIKTPEECMQHIEQENKKIERENLVYRCPVNAHRLSQKNKEKDARILNLVDDNDNLLNQEEMIADTENVYLVKNSSGMSGFFNKGGYQIMGPADSHGLNLAAYEE